MRERYRVLASILILAALLVIVVARIASAHGNLESASPAPNSTIPSAPERVSARFSEELDPDGSSLRVRGPDGVYVDRGDSAADLNDPDRTLMHVSLESGLGPGVYTVEWVTLSSEDDHREEGTFRFTIDPDAPEVETPALVAPVGTQTPLPVGGVDSTASSSRAALITGIVAVLIAVLVVAAVGRRRISR